jgi:outer membrane beta-barrel protein
MRGIHRSVIVALGLLVAAPPAFAQPKKGPAPKEAPKPKEGPKKGEPEPEIEMSGDDKKDTKGDGKDAGVNPEEIDMGEPPPTDLNTDLNAIDQNNQVVKAGPAVRTPLSWKDILVVVRKPFLKSHRTELYPMFGTTMNDNMIRHYTMGGEISYFLTDVLAVGVEGQYYIDTFREPFDLVARQARRLPTVNRYLWSGALDFHYVPVYGKFAILDHRLVTWEVQFTAGIGAGQSKVIPRDKTFDPFTNLLIMPNVGAQMRFFLAKWLTVNVGVRDYMFIDHYEPTMRVEGGMNDSADEAKDNSSSSFVNNVMFQIGLSFWLPTSFEYTTFR